MDTVAHQVLLVPSQYPTIQAAVDAVDGAATIMVEPGVYEENLVVADRGSLVIASARLSRRGVTLAGAPGAGGSVVVATGSTLHLSGIEVRSHGRRRGIRVDGGRISLQDCLVAGNRSAAGPDDDGFGAGMCCRDAAVHVQKSTLAANVVDSSPGTAAAAEGGGLYLARCTVEIAGSTLVANAAHSAVVARGGGIRCDGGRMRMWKSRVTENLLRAPRCEGAGIAFSGDAAAELGGSVVMFNAAHAGRGGGVFVAGEAAAVHVHRNSVVRQNHPDDLAPA